MENNIVFEDNRQKRLYDIAVISGIGGRESQQDSAYVTADDSRIIAVLCDGMGGYAGGSQAGITAIGAFLQYYRSHSNRLSSIWECMRDSVEYADHAVYMLKDENGNRLKAGSTLVAADIGREGLHWVSVGDSRAYIIRKMEIAQINTDHNYFYTLNQRLSRKEIDEREYGCESSSGEQLISYMGMGGLQLIDLNETAFPLLTGDTVILCTDGFYRTISDEKILEVIVKTDSMWEAAAAFRNMIESSISRFQDNYTYILIKKEQAEIYE